MNVEVEWWDRPVEHRRGSPVRLCGVDIFYDFPWSDYFPDGRAQFKNGLYLARLAQNECPPGKAPGLLLTATEDPAQVPIETESRYLVVVDFPRYLREASYDPAASYYAHVLDHGIADLPRLQELVRRPDVIQAVLDEHLDATQIAQWAAQNAERMEQLRAIASQASLPAQPAPSMELVITALQTIEVLDPDIVTALEAFLGNVADRETRIAFLKALTKDRTGRYVTSEVLGHRIEDRLHDAEAAAAGYAMLLADATSRETDLQHYIEEHPWLVGLEYVKVRPRLAVPRGALDFILERYDGSHDLLELKNPGDPIILAPDAVDGMPPSASDFALSPALSQALAQVHVYRDVLTEDAPTVERLYGLKKTRDPRLIIVVGQAADLPDHRLRVLRALNLSLHRVEVVPYDALVERTRTLLANVQTHLAQWRDADGSADGPGHASGPSAAGGSEQT